MDMQELNSYGSGGIAQYDMPQNYELVGQKYEFAMDDGIDFKLHFVDRSAIAWNYAGEEPRLAHNYFCKKGDDTTYLVSYELEGAQKRTNHTWVIDLENWLVTRILAVIGENPRYEYLITPVYTFGAVKREGYELSTYPRHGFTDDLCGNIVQWNYGAMETVHLYYCANYYRITYPPEREGTRRLYEAMEKLPSSDEPVAYIKIKNGMYLFSLTESNMEKILGDEMPFRSNTMAFLQNYKHVYLVGRAFGTTTIDGNAKPMHTSFGAFGKVIKPTNEYILKTLTDPNPYIV